MQKQTENLINEIHKYRIDLVKLGICELEGAVILQVLKAYENKKLMPPCHQFILRKIRVENKRAIQRLYEIDFTEHYPSKDE